jgi:hypothetical protein
VAELAALTEAVIGDVPSLPIPQGRYAYRIMSIPRVPGT